ncbi:MAG: RHS repeat-associated core domain-containing protein, partial [Ferruginibacter sp.]
GNIAQFGYDSNGNLVTATSPGGLTITNTYDKLNRTIRSQDQQGIIFNREYDASGNIIRSINATGAVTEFTYDDLNRVIKVRDALGNYVNTTYDNNGKVLTLTNRKNKTASYAYDALNRITSFTDNNGSVISSTYDASSNLLSIRDQNNNTTNYQRDNLNRQTQIIFPNGKYIEYTYDNIGNILTNRRPDGSVISYVYDSINQLITKTLPGNNQFNYTYDPMKRLLTATNSSGVAGYSYDALGRKITESVNGKIVRYNYNTPAREQTTIYPDSTIVIKKFTTRGLLASIAKDSGIIASYQYSPANQLLQKSFANGVISNRQFDFANRLSTINTASGNIQNTNFSYDNVVNKTAITKNNNPAASEQFTYDDDNRLIAFKRGPIGGAPLSEHVYQFDAVGNRTSVVVNGSTTNYTTNNLNQVTGSSGAVNIAFTFDDNGNLTYDGTYHKKYDAERRLLLDSMSPSNKIVYSYDATGRRISKIINGYSINYVYAGLTQLQQIDAGADTALNSTVFANFLRPVLMTKGNNSFYYHQDEMNSVEALTTSNGSLAERYQYDPFGKQTIFNSSGGVIPSSLTGNRFGFTGHESDTETKTLHFPAREYSPETGNFNQRDPLGYYAGMGMYQYVNNNPTNYIDLLGLEPVTGSETVDRMVSDGSSATQGVTAIADDFLAAKANEQAANIAKWEQNIAANMARIKDLAYNKGYDPSRINKAIEGFRMQQLMLLKEQLKQNQLLKKLKNLGRLGPILTTVDLWWKIERYRSYKAKCPGSDEDLLQQSLMVKDIAFAGTGFNPATWIIHLGDFATEKIFDKSASNKLVETSFWANNWLEANAPSVSTPFGDVALNPLIVPNLLGTGLGHLAVGGSYTPTSSDAFYANPVNYIK